MKSGNTISTPVKGAIKTALLEDLIQFYLTDCELQLQAAQTIATRRVFLQRLLLFLKHKNHAICGQQELRLFFHYLVHGHEDPNGRFGKPHLKKPVRPVTIRDYYISLRTFFAWLVAQHKIDESPFEHIPKPRVREDIKAPLSLNQVATLLEIAKTSNFPERDRAMILMLLDTGCRASELVSLRWADMDLEHGCCNVIGKGNKARTVFFGSSTASALFDYRLALYDFRDKLGLSERDVEFAGQTSLLLSGRNLQPLKRDGLQQVMERLGRRSGITASCSPHAFRRTFAVQMLRNGANVFSVQALLGHSDLEMTRRYCAIAQTDVQSQHRNFSPVDRFEADNSREYYGAESRPLEMVKPSFSSSLSLTQQNHVAVY